MPPPADFRYGCAITTNDGAFSIAQRRHWLSVLGSSAAKHSSSTTSFAFCNKARAKKRRCWDLAQQSIRQTQQAKQKATKHTPNNDGCVPHAKAAIRFRRHFAITPLACELINHPAPVRHSVPAPLFFRLFC